MAEVENWDEYWKCRSLKRSLIESVRELYFARVFTHEVTTLAQPGSRVLEVGSGSGTYLRLLERLGYRVHGIDLSPEAILYSRARGTQGVSLGDIHTLPFHDKSFDVAYNQGVMEHFEDPEFRVILSEMNRVAEKVAVIVPSALSVLRIYDVFGDDPHKRFFNKSSLGSLFVEHMTDVKVKYLWSSGFLSIIATGQCD